MPAYKAFASTPADRTLLIDALPEGSLLREKVHRAHLNAATRRAKALPGTKTSEAIDVLRDQCRARPDLASIIRIGILAIERTNTPSAYTVRVTRGIATLNLTDADRTEARAALKAHARQFPEHALECRVLYQRIKP